MGNGREITKVGSMPDAERCGRRPKVRVVAGKAQGVRGETEREPHRLSFRDVVSWLFFSFVQHRATVIHRCKPSQTYICVRPGV